MACTYFETILNDFVSKLWRKIYFIFCPKQYDWGLTFVTVYYFHFRNKKEHILIISRLISSHIVLMYIETSYKTMKYFFSNFRKKWSFLNFWFQRMLSPRHFLPSWISLKCWNFVITIYYFYGISVIRTGVLKLNSALAISKFEIKKNKRLAKVYFL